MKTYTLTKNEVVDGKKVFIGSCDIDEPETFDEFLAMVNNERLTSMRDWKSGRRVRKQSEMARHETKTDKLDKLAIAEGFDSYADMIEQARAFKDANVTPTS